LKEKSKALQPFVTVVAACPGRDMIRIWPLPVVDAWFEDGREGISETMRKGERSVRNDYR